MTSDNDTKVNTFFALIKRSKALDSKDVEYVLISISKYF